LFSQEVLRSFITNAGWIVLAPFLVGLVIILFARHSKPLSMVLSVGAVLYGFIHSLLIFYALTQPGVTGGVVLDMPYFVSSSFTLHMGVLVDNLATMMLIVVTAVSLLVQIYTHGYMREDPGYSRFYSYLSLFTGSMLGLVISTNLFEMFFFWELVGVCSYLLIGFWFYKDSAAAACVKAFVINRIGDFGFLIGILMLFAATTPFIGSGHQNLWGATPVLSFLGANGGPDLAQVLRTAYETRAIPYWGLNGLFVMAVMMFMGPVAKSAQFPLHTWLPDAMEGPTPISALIHAATMVAAGVYLVARAYPIWVAPPEIGMQPALFIIAATGCLTSFMAATIAMSQFDIKRTLAWSTVSQLGYMFVGLGAGAFTGGLFHLFNHAFFKAMLFLCSGAVIHGLHGEQDMRKMGGLKKEMKGTGLCFLIGCIAISGFPPFSGFFSKDDIIASAWNFNHFIGGMMILTAGLTSFYMFRAYFMTFSGEYRGGDVKPHNSGPAMVYPLIALALPSMMSGFLGFNPSSFASINWNGEEGGVFPNPFGSFVYYLHPHFEGINGMIMLVSVVVAGLGWFVAFLMYRQHSLNINTVIANSKNPLIGGAYRFSFNKWYFDEVYTAIYMGILAFYRKLWQGVDMLVVDNIVNGTSLVTSALGQFLKYSQNGRGQSYALVIFGCVAVLTLLAYFIKP
jgi:NAD(P)H-quinone oxidoreductase subunit 5